MARVLTDGAEFKDTIIFSSTLVATINSTYKRSGSYAYDIAGGGGYGHITIAAVSELYIRFGLYLVSGVTGICRLMKGTTVIAELLYTSPSSCIYLQVNGSTVATGTQALTVNGWNLIEWHYKMADSGESHTKINGVADIDYSGDTKPGSDTTVDGLRFYATGSALVIDDIAINDTTGGSDDSWCGDGHIELLTPMTGGTYAWTGSDGDSVDNYAMVDEFAADNDTTYVKSSTASQQDIYTLTDFTATGKIVTRIYSECRAKDNDATSGQIKIGFKTDGTVYLCSSARTLTGNYARVVGDEAKVNPFDSGTWEDADLDAIQFVVECE